MKHIIENANLKSLNTFGIDVDAKGLINVSNQEELIEALEIVKKSQLPMLIIGGGSNILFTRDFAGIVICNKLKGISIVKDDDQSVWVKSMAGEVWHDFVLFCVEKSWGGIENLSLIPGSVGAAPMQNIGAYGAEIKDVFYSLEALEISSGKLVEFNKDDCQFGYRESVFKRKLKNQFVITSVTFQLAKNPKYNTSYGAIETQLQQMKVKTPLIKDISNAVIAIRQSKLPDPKLIGNAGSFFKNPLVSKDHFNKIKSIHSDCVGYPVNETEIKLAAGWLIEKSGLKGFTKGNYGIHKLQALVLVNYGGATGSEIYNLSTEIINTVQHKFDVALEREVNIY